MTVPGIEELEVGPPPLLRAALGVLLGLVTGLVAAAVLPRDQRPADDRPEPGARAERTRTAGPR